MNPTKLSFHESAALTFDAPAFDPQRHGPWSNGSVAADYARDLPHHFTSRDNFAFAMPAPPCPLTRLRFPSLPLLSPPWP